MTTSYSAPFTPWMVETVMPVRLAKTFLKVAISANPSARSRFGVRRAAAPSTVPEAV